MLPVNSAKQIGFYISVVSEKGALLHTPELRHWRLYGDNEFLHMQANLVELLAIWLLQLRARCYDEGALPVPQWP